MGYAEASQNSTTSTELHRDMQILHETTLKLLRERGGVVGVGVGVVREGGREGGGRGPVPECFLCCHLVSLLWSACISPIYVFHKETKEKRTKQKK